MIARIWNSPIASMMGLVGGFVLAAASPGWWDIVRSWYEDLHPVVTDWQIGSVSIEGADVVLSGTMRKNRECLLVPPVVARDENDRPYRLEAPMWSHKDAAAELQTWGPWRVVNGAGRSLKFTMIYMCAGNYPTIVGVGKYEAPR